MTNSKNPVFIPKPISLWKGRYGRILGGSCWKITWVSNSGYHPAVHWVRGDSIGTCHYEAVPAAEAVAEAVVKGKRHLGFSGGGSFVINEFGQVIVPSSAGDGRRVIVGEVGGTFFLENPFSEDEDKEWMDISDDTDLECGDPWEKPYLGVVYHLSKRDNLYYASGFDKFSKPSYPPVQDDDLVSRIRSIRRYGPVRIIVNPYGIALVKKPVDSEWSRNNKDIWDPVYVGRIDYNAWFEKEE